jgi:hypothetical protein
MNNPITPTYSEMRLADRLGRLASQVEAGEAPDEEALLATLREAQFILLGTRNAGVQGMGADQPKGGA